MSYAAKVVCDSVSPEGVRLTTIEVTFPRIVLAEFNTHRVFSRNSASSRAIPIAKRIAMVESAPYVPEQFGRNQRGMQSGAALEGDEAERAQSAWLYAARDAVYHARTLESAGVHKEYANRLLEPFCWHIVFLGLLSGNPADEERFLQRLSAWRVRGEWFRLERSSVLAMAETMAEVV